MYGQNPYGMLPGQAMLPGCQQNMLAGQMYPGQMTRANAVRHKVRIISKAHHTVLTFVEDNTPAMYHLGKRGNVIAEPVIFDNPLLHQNQHFELRPNMMHGANAFSIHLCRNPSFVLRHTPLAPMHKINIWQDDQTAPNQFWKFEHGLIKPLQHPLENLHSNGAGSYLVGAEPEHFYLDMDPNIGMGM